MRNCLVCHDELFVNNPLNVKENDKHALHFPLYSPLQGLLPCFRITTVNPALVTSDIPGQEGYIVGGDLTKLLADVDTPEIASRLQIKGRKKLTRPPSCVEFCTLTHKIC
jgi:hypothetical protein